MTAPPRCLKYGTLPKRGIQRACKKSIVIGLVRGRAGGGRPHRSRGELWPKGTGRCLAACAVQSISQRDFWATRQSRGSARQGGTGCCPGKTVTAAGG